MSLQRRSNLMKIGFIDRWEIAQLHDIKRCAVIVIDS